MNYYNDGTFRRVNKTTARNLHAKGKEIFICSCNMRPDNNFCPAYPIGFVKDFDKFVAIWEVQNCTCAETGRRASFYVKCKEDE